MNEGDEEMMQAMQESMFITYDESIKRTVNADPQAPPMNRCTWFFSKLAGGLGQYQLLFYALLLVLKNAVTPLLFGASFLTKPAHSYECYYDADDEWRECSKQEICDNHYGADHWRPVHDDEYIDNWVSPDKLDLLCENKFKVGFIISVYFIGVIATVLVVPLISDRGAGRKLVFLASTVLFTVAFLGVILATNLYEIYVFMFLMGCCFPGRVILGITYMIESTP